MFCSLEEPRTENIRNMQDGQLKADLLLLANANEEDMIELMLAEPRLIKRPLIRVNDHLVIGSDKSALSDLIQSI